MHGDLHQAQYVDTPLKTVFRQFSTNWTPIQTGQEVPDFAAMEHVAFSDLDDTKFEEPSVHNITYDHLKEPTGKGALEDDPHTSHFIGGMLRDINPKLGNLYFGGAANVPEKTEYHDTIKTHPDVRIMHPPSVEFSGY